MKALKGRETITVIQTEEGKSPSDVVTTTVKLTPIPKPTVDEPVIEGDAVHPTGTGVPNYWIAIDVAGSGFELDHIGGDGKWRTLNPIKLHAGQVLTIKQRHYEFDDHESEAITTTVQAKEE